MILRESTPTQRAAHITRHFVYGHKYTSSEAADMLGISVRAAQIMLNQLAGAIPIYRDDDGRWQELIPLSTPHKIIIHNISPY